MVKRLGRWWQLWVALAVIWTFAAAGSAWIDLPRASNVPHDPEFLNQLSSEASAIVRGSASADQPASGAPLWSDTPRLFRMSNGEQLQFPAITTAERAAVVENEYRELLRARANGRRWSYLLERLAWWLAPLLIAGFALGAARGGRDFSHGQTIAPDDAVSVR
ncbi:MAG: hypothetical protein ABI547_07575 [Betaproteobacteria bacterium]